MWTFPHYVGGTPTYVRTLSGWVYVAFVTDVYSRRIVGWQTTREPVCTDLAQGRPLEDGYLAAQARRSRPEGPDPATRGRGVQYRAIRVRAGPLRL
ncbi:hypothetical protein [Actinomyces qiguomingii]|uniref:hypothetical protein n=1 Tax=Actinomyces qiguomingii TaxID=2057800 RepID=UPI000FFE7110|nr:hypothetical protein [Actinomyces qiguomingii]